MSQAPAGQNQDDQNKQPSSETQAAMPRENQNPLTQEEIEKRTQQAKMNEQQQKVYNEQLEIKMRTEMQGFKYTPPKGMENYPGLAATPDNANLQDISTQPAQVNPNINETVIEVTPPSQKAPVQIKKDEPAQQAQTQSAQGIKG
jgi:hypothetical protein